MTTPTLLPLGLLLGFLDDGTIWILIPLTALAIPIVAILVQPFQTRMKMIEREKLRQMYERLALEKLDVVKTAVAMGYKQADLADLDSRLEKVIGSDAMQKVLDGKSPSTYSGSSGSLPSSLLDDDDDEDGPASGSRKERARQRARERNQ